MGTLEKKCGNVYHVCSVVLQVRHVLAREKVKERDQYFNTVVSDSLGAGVPWYVPTQLKNCPVKRLRQYLNSTCSHYE